MNGLPTRLEQLPPMRVAAVRAVGVQPEQQAWNQLRHWAESRGLLRDLKKHPVFGFSLPAQPGKSVDYGYEWWIRVGPNTETDGAVELKDFEGGLFLVASGVRASTAPETWMKLWQLARGGRYRWRGTQELEKPRDPLGGESDPMLDLYLPVRAVTETTAPPAATRPLSRVT